MNTGSEWTCRAAFVFKVFSCEIKNFQLDISLGTFSHIRTHPFQSKSSHAEPFAAFYFSLFLFSKTLVLQTLMRANAMTQAGCLSLLLVSFLSLALPLSVFRRRWVNHMARVAQSQKIMGSYSSLIRLSKFHTEEKSFQFHFPGNSKDSDKSTSLDNYIMYGF